MRLIPDTVVGRTLLVLLVGLTGSHLVSMAFYVTDRASALDLAGGEHLAERIVTLARVVENAPSVERDELVGLADHPTLRVSRSHESGLTGDGEDSWKADVLRRSFQEHLNALGERNFALRLRAAAATDHMPGRRHGHAGMHPAVLVSLQISDGSWLNFRAMVEPGESIWTMRFVLSMAVMIGAVVVLSAIVVQYLNRPLRVFAKAARRLGRDVQAPPLLERGPREVREAIQAFNEMQARVRRLVEDRTQMLTAVSHDLRTPITLLRLRAEFIDDEDERTKILATLDEMESMVASILNFARDDSEMEDLRPVDLAALVGSICDDMADAGLAVVFDGPEKLTCECRASTLKRALTNVIENALKYGKTARVSLTDSPQAVTITVDDEGPGIPEAEMEKVFTPFYRLERSRSAETGGVGLGLTVTRTIVVAQGGGITLENREGGGLTVAVTLPR